MDTTLWWLPAAVWCVVGAVLVHCWEGELTEVAWRIRRVKRLQPLLFSLSVQQAYQKNSILYLVPRPWARHSVQAFVDSQCIQLPFPVEVFSLDDEA